MTDWYKEDLAYVHDVGHARFALETAPGMIRILERSGVRSGLVVDLGCGSGILARELVDAGYGVVGIDISEAMIEISRRRVPEAEFRVGSLFEVEIPPCDAVTAVGEVLNYLFGESAHKGLSSLFRRVYDALNPGGAFVFDLLRPGQIPARGGRARTFSEGKDWVVAVDKEEDPTTRILTRRIVSFRRVGEYYRRDDETHRQRLYEPARVAEELRRAGFRARISRSYGRYQLSSARRAFVARKPA
jgi:SAM-dependent methyltransferase